MNEFLDSDIFKCVREAICVIVTEFSLDTRVISTEERAKSLTLATYLPGFCRALKQKAEIWFAVFTIQIVQVPVAVARKLSSSPYHI